MFNRIVNVQNISSKEVQLFNISGLLKVLINVVTCSAYCNEDFSNFFIVKVNLLVPTADKSSINLKNWYRVLTQENLF